MNQPHNQHPDCRTWRSSDEEDSSSDNSHDDGSEAEESNTTRRFRANEATKRTPEEHRLLTHAMLAGASNGIQLLCEVAVRKGALVDAVGSVASVQLLLPLPPGLSSLPGLALPTATLVFLGFGVCSVRESPGSCW